MIRGWTISCCSLNLVPKHMFILPNSALKSPNQIFKFWNFCKRYLTLQQIIDVRREFNMNDLWCTEITRSDKIMVNLRRNQGQDDSPGEQEINRNGKKNIWKTSEKKWPCSPPRFYFPSFKFGLFTFPPHPSAGFPPAYLNIEDKFLVQLIPKY